MQVGIIVADSVELEAINLPEEFVLINQFRVYELQLVNVSAKLIISGVGLANAAAAAQVLISVCEVEALYNFGSVGAYGPGLEINTLVMPERLYYHDVFTPWKARGHLPYEEPFYFNALPPSLKAHYATFNLASGNSFFTSLHEAQQLSELWKIAIYDMEAAAIGQIAAQNVIPFTVVKCVSDLIGVSAQVDLTRLNKRIAASAARAYDLVTKIIQLNATHL